MNRRNQTQLVSQDCFRKFGPGDQLYLCPVHTSVFVCYHISDLAVLGQGSVFGVFVETESCTVRGLMSNFFATKPAWFLVSDQPELSLYSGNLVVLEESPTHLMVLDKISDAIITFCCKDSDLWMAKTHSLPIQQRVLVN